MSASAFDPSFEQLPEVLPIFPLPGALVLPRGQLPLNIFEPRYLNMIQAALAGDRMIGMIQPNQLSDAPESAPAPLYQTGCVGRITAFSETDDGRLLITLKGVIRFEVARELPLKDGYRRVIADYQPYRSDLAEDGGSIDREALFGALGGYLEKTGMEGDWNALKDAADEPLVTWLAMGCPFEPREKQALLEAATLSDRAETMLAILRMASLDPDSGSAHH